jgi:tetratricopeptide (TPR) repeat protein
VRNLTEPSIIARLLIPLAVLIFSGIVPRPHVVIQALQQAGLQARLEPLEGGSPQAAARAAKALAQAAEHIPWRADLWEQAGQLALNGADFRSAIAYFERAAAQNALSPGGRISLGDAFMGTGDLAAAADAWQQALQAQGPSEALLSKLLETHRSLGDYPAAIADLQALTSLRPADATLRYQLGLLLATQQPDAALAHLTQAAELDPSLKAKAQELVARIRTASLSGDPAQTLFEAGRALASIDEWRLAVEAFRQATVVRPDFADAWAFWGEARQHVEDFSLNPVPPLELEKALSLEPASLSANTLMALFYQRHARFDQAVEYLRKVTKLYPENPALQVELGEALALSGDLEAGLQAYQQAVALAPQDPAYHRQLAGYCIRYEYRLREIGLASARQAVLLDPQGADSLDVLGQALFILGDLANAERFYLRALEAQPKYISALLHLGLVYMLQGERQRARQEWSLVISLAPGTPAAQQAQRLINNYFP